MKEVYFQKIRGILILGVVFIHCAFKCNNAINNCISIVIRTFCNLAVPTFIFLSAYFFNFQKYKNDSKKYLINKIKRLLIPLLLWNIIYYKLNYNNNSIIDFITFETAPQLYYIVVLIQLILLTPLLDKGLKNSKIKVLLYCVTPVALLLYRILYIGFNYTFTSYKLFFSHWLIYYLIGLEARNKKRINITATNMLTRLKPIILIGGGVICYNLAIYYFLDFKYAITQMNCVNMIFSIFIFKFILDNKHKTNESFLSKVGDRSFGIFFIHFFIYKELNKYFIILKKSSIFSNQLIFIIITSILVYLVSYFTIIIFSKITKGKFDLIFGFK